MKENEGTKTGRDAAIGSGVAASAEHRADNANHARDGDVTEGYAADWTVEQLREPAQQVANRIDVLCRASTQGA